MSDSYFVKYKSRLQGPFSIDQLKLLMKRGKLTRAHLVSEDRKTWVALGEIKGIVKETTTTQESEHVADTPPQNVHQDQPVGTAQPPMQPIGNPQQYDQQHTGIDGQPNQYSLNPATALELMSKRFMGWIMTSGIILAVMIVLPISIITFGNKSEILWSWSGWEQYPANIKFLFIYTILASAALIVISVTTRGLARAVTTLGIVFVAGMLLLSNSFEANEGILRVALMVIPCAILAAAFQWKRLGPTLPRRVIICVVGGITALVCTSYTIEMLIEMDLAELDGAPSEVTTMAIFAIIMCVAGLGLGIASGVLGILQVKPDASTSTSNLGLVFSRIAPVCLLLGFLVLVLGIGMALANQFNEHSILGAFSLLAVRMIVAPLALLVLIECGTYELMLVCSSFATKQPPQHGGVAEYQVPQQTNPQTTGTPIKPPPQYQQPSQQPPQQYQQPSQQPPQQYQQPSQQPPQQYQQPSQQPPQQPPTNQF